MARNANHEHWVHSLAQLLADTFSARVLRDVILDEFPPLRRRAIERAILLAEEQALGLSMLATVQSERLGVAVGPPAEQLRVEQ